MSAECISPSGLSSRAALSVVGLSIGGGVRRSLFSALGKVYIKAFLTADRVIIYIDRIVIRLLAEYGSLIPDRSYALYNAAVSCYSGIDLYLLTLVV